MSLGFGHLAPKPKLAAVLPAETETETETEFSASFGADPETGTDIRPTFSSDCLSYNSVECERTAFRHASSGRIVTRSFLIDMSTAR